MSLFIFVFFFIGSCGVEIYAGGGQSTNFAIVKAGIFLPNEKWERELVYCFSNSNSGLVLDTKLLPKPRLSSEEIKKKVRFNRRVNSGVGQVFNGVLRSTSLWYNIRCFAPNFSEGPFNSKIVCGLYGLSYMALTGYASSYLDTIIGQRIDMWNNIDGAVKFIPLHVVFNVAQNVIHSKYGFTVKSWWERNGLCGTSWNPQLESE